MEQLKSNRLDIADNTLFCLTHLIDPFKKLKKSNMNEWMKNSDNDKVSKINMKCWILKFPWNCRERFETHQYIDYSIVKNIL